MKEQVFTVSITQKSIDARLRYGAEVGRMPEAIADLLSEELDLVATVEPAKPTAEEFLLWMQSQCNTPCHQCKMLKACNSNSDMCFGSVDIDLVLKLFNERKK